ncbi:hypothetical protein Tco_0937460 [Tanacetum coccineum]|uniref:Uncharacterized protein n=1 Tax=Tanacetum coccineum TaxID=301880 RepID=A0ABQ5DEA5_9ASTR
MKVPSREKQPALSGDAGVKNGILIFGEESEEEATGASVSIIKLISTSGGSGGGRVNDGSRSKWNDSNLQGWRSSKEGSFDLSETFTKLVNLLDRLIIKKETIHTPAEELLA